MKAPHPVGCACVICEDDTVRRVEAERTAAYRNNPNPFGEPFRTSELSKAVETGRQNKQALFEWQTLDEGEQTRVLLRLSGLAANYNGPAVDKPYEAAMKALQALVLR